ncbi:hypothetical protein [Rhodoferax sp.]|uniref:hypothetical protein n=1 Tax=Rhodoferax sp. TaxID=50421 RepID=UPI002618C187|nr:hypothetical protein [Rhodoferax sp.]MDD3936126.1 hypothetical protein [Rhodoferax sp.]
MKLLLSGLDTVECAYYLRPGATCKLDFEALRLQREVMRQSKTIEPMKLELGGIEFMLSPNGTKSGYPFLVSNQDFTIQFGEFNNPSFFVKFSSFALWNQGAKLLHERFLQWADTLGFIPDRPEGLSRCDFAFDFHLEQIDFDEDSFVTVAAKDSQHRKDGKVQTFTFGRDEVVLRVYNKSAEIEESSGKYWLHPLWQGQTENVWRVEWQVRKETLKRFGLRTFQDLFDGYGDCLRYLVAEHTSLRVKMEDSNRSRWPVHPLWALLSQQIDQLPAQGIYREVNSRAMLDETLMRMAISMEGYLKKVAAIECLKEGRPMISQSQTIDRLIPLLEKVHNGLTWRGDVQKRMDQLRLS